MSTLVASNPQFIALQRLVSETLEQDIATLLHHANLPSSLFEACAYALSDGKRVRPLLVASAWLTVKNNPNSNPSSNIETSFASDPQTYTDTTTIATINSLPSSVRRAMLAVECLHAYSLIHDDLPCMDDDDLRRGKPTCHVKFGEATALLAGDVLQTLAFEVLTFEVLTANLPTFEPIDDALSQRLHTTFAPRARRMVAGQMRDLLAENQSVSQTELETIHRDKTGALIEASVLMGGICGDASLTNLSKLEQFGASIGLAFQVQDDVLDVTADTETLGKRAGSDDKLAKSTYVTLLGVENAKQYAEGLFAEATDALATTFHSQSMLEQLASWLWQRKF